MTDTLKSQVETILKDHPETRNSDIELTKGIWRKFYGVTDFIPLSSLGTLPTQETVKRLRALFNQSGKYLPTNETVLLKRAKHSETVRKFIKQTKMEFNNA